MERRGDGLFFSEICIVILPKALCGFSIPSLILFSKYCFIMRYETVVAVMMMEIGTIICLLIFNRNEKHQLKLHYATIKSIIHAESCKVGTSQ